jgi:hypothetical protein
MTSATIVRTDDVVRTTGIYQWQRYLDDANAAPPPVDERQLVMKRGDVVPPVRSSGKGSIWKLIWAG